MVKSKNDLDISVLIATYNRAEILRQTLEGMTGLDREGISIEFVVVDNNSSDHTKQVIESFSDRLPLRYLFEPRPGKNCALNKALNEVSLGKLVVFTDDDVEPKKDWLKRIREISDRWPEYSVFGGKIYPIWPYPQVPAWAKSFKIEGFAFAAHNYADSECRYEDNAQPVGPNFWVRAEVFANGRRYNETVGPRPTNRIMGSETSFLRQLKKDGFSFIYSPMAIVGHRISPEQLVVSNLIKRAYRWGRGKAHVRPFCRPALFNKSKILWYLVRFGAVMRALCLLVSSTVGLILKKNPEKIVSAMHVVGYNVEIIKITVWEKKA